MMGPHCNTLRGRRCDPFSPLPWILLQSLNPQPALEGGKCDHSSHLPLSPKETLIIDLIGALTISRFLLTMWHWWAHTGKRHWPTRSIGLSTFLLGLSNEAPESKKINIYGQELEPYITSLDNVTMWLFHKNRLWGIRIFTFASPHLAPHSLEMDPPPITFLLQLGNHSYKQSALGFSMNNWPCCV